MAKSTLKERLKRGRSLLRTRLVRRGFGPAALPDAGDKRQPAGQHHA